MSNTRERALWKTLAKGDAKFFFYQAAFIQEEHRISILDLKNTDGHSLLFAALAMGHQKIADELLACYEKEPERLTNPTENDKLLLWQAAAQGYTNFVERIVKLLDKQTRDEFFKSQHPKMGTTPLTVAIAQGHIETIQFLLKQMEDWDAELIEEIFSLKDKKENTLLHLACMDGNNELVKKLIDRLSPDQAKFYENYREYLDHTNQQVDEAKEKGKEKIKEGEEESNHSILHEPSILMYNFKLDSYMSAQNKALQTCLIIAAEKGNSDLVFFLLSKIAPNLEQIRQETIEIINISDINGCTALHHACQRGDIKTIHALLCHGANTNLVNNQGQMPFDLIPIDKIEDKQVFFDTLAYTGGFIAAPVLSPSLLEEIGKAATAAEYRYFMLGLSCIEEDMLSENIVVDPKKATIYFSTYNQIIREQILQRCFLSLKFDKSLSSDVKANMIQFFYPSLCMQKLRRYLKWKSEIEDENNINPLNCNSIGKARMEIVNIQKLITQLGMQFPSHSYRRMFKLDPMYLLQFGMILFFCIVFSGFLTLFLVGAAASDEFRKNHQKVDTPTLFKMVFGMAGLILSFLINLFNVMYLGFKAYDNIFIIDNRELKKLNQLITRLEGFINNLNVPTGSELDTAVNASRQSLNILKLERNPQTIRGILRNQILPETDRILAAVNTGQYSPLFFVTSKSQSSLTATQPHDDLSESSADETQGLLQHEREEEFDVESGDMPMVKIPTVRQSQHK